MNHLVFLDSRAGELEKILSGIKTMIIEEIEPEGRSARPVSPGDSLYFLRDRDECDLQVAATVIRVLPITNNLGEDLPQILKEMQPRLQFTEAQYNYWAAKMQVLLVDFESAHKIPVIHIASHKITDRSDWIVFDDFSLITTLEV
jgi:hypothetical protein